MLINDLRSFCENSCSCGKNHELIINDILLEKGAIFSLPKKVLSFGAKKAFIIMDSKTLKVAGQSAVELLIENSVETIKFVYENQNLEPDDEALKILYNAFDKSCDIVIGVGSGVINDLGKMLAYKENKPYIIVATAPSMDGYASASSSMILKGLKVSVNSKCADVIIGDIDILRNAPLEMLKAGIGDMLAKYVSLAEWKIASEIRGEYYCPRVASLMREALKKCVDNASELLNRNEEAVKSVFEGLIIGGLAMAFAGVSRPASGVEHYLSHVWDMRGLEFGTKVNFHGIQCAVGTFIAVKLYEKLLKITPSKEKALKYVKEFNYDDWATTLKEFLGKSSISMIELEKKEEKYSVQKHAKRLEIIFQKWDVICQIIKEEIPSVQEFSTLLDLIKLPKSCLDMGLECDQKLSFKATKDIRDKYVLSFLLWDLGLLDQVLEEQFS